MAINVEVFSTNTCPHCPGAIDVALAAKEELGDAIDVEIVKIDKSEENRQRAMEYQIMAVPTIMINGELGFMGAPSYEELIEKLKSLL